MKKQYVGDSVYVEYVADIDALILTTENGLPSDPSNRIILETEVWAALRDYVDDLRVSATEAK